MELWEDYLAERKGAKTIKSEKGFAVYYDTPPDGYLEEIYVKPSYRQHGLAGGLARIVEKKCLDAGCGRLLGSCDPLANGSSQSMLAMLKYGFELSHIQGNLIILSRELKGEDNG